MTGLAHRPARAPERDASPLRERFHEDGYLVSEGAFSDVEVDEILEEAVAICRGERGPVAGADPGRPGESVEEVLARHLCIHNPHKISDLLLRWMSAPPVVDILTEVIGPNVKCMQSMLFIKAAGKPGQAWHQDEFYIPTRDRTLTGAWIPLDDATTENGCLWVIPGSHKSGVIWPQRLQENPDFDCAGEAWRFPYRDDDAVPVEVNRGSIVFFNGYLLHRSLPNRTRSGYRRALVNHYMSAESLLPWYLRDGENGASGDFRDIVIVAGEDPYAWKGTESRLEPRVRPSGEGGCGEWGRRKADASNPDDK